MSKKPTGKQSSRKSEERIFKGLATAPGIAIGKAYVRFAYSI